MDTEIQPTPEGLTRAEAIKAASRHLRGAIKQELGEATPAFTEESAAILKFHGIYQQDDRDRRREARRLGLDKHHMMMIRTRIPGGQVTPDGYLAHDAIASAWGNDTLRITTRQCFQTHGVLKGDLHSAVHAINAALMTSLGGCGDQVRNIMSCPAPAISPFSDAANAYLRDLVAALTPQTRAYHEIWVDGDLVHSGAPDGESEPLYGEQYLPRKFKVAVAVDGDNCVDIHANDLGFVIFPREDGAVAGVNVLVGGGLGRTHNKPETYPLASVPMAFVEPDQVVPVARAVVTVQRDFGDRTNRRHARLKYLIADRGLDWFRDQVRARLEFDLAPPRAMTWKPVDDHLGWHERGDGRLYHGLFVENGRIQDGPDGRLRSALRQIVAELRTPVRLTAQQNLILESIARGDRDRVDEILAAHSVARAEDIPQTLRNSMACPAYPTCGLAVAEAERLLPSLIREIALLIDGLGLSGERISYRMTGCPNGCARPYLGDVGFVGTTLGKYDVYLGGDFEGTRLNTLYAHNVPAAEITALLEGPLRQFRSERRAGEGFGNWVHRVGVDDLRGLHGVPAVMA